MRRACASYCHLALVCVLQSKIVPLCQVEVDTNQVKQHLPWRPLLGRKGVRDRLDEDSGGGEESNADTIMSHHIFLESHMYCC